MTTEIKLLEVQIKEIFFKSYITQDDINRANKFIKRWKKLTNWIEATEYPIKYEPNYMLT